MGKSNGTAKRFYGTVIGMIGIMMTCAAIFDCIVPPDHMHDLIPRIIGNIDVTFTSSIAVGFFFCALIDMKVVKDTVRLYVVYIGCIMVLFWAWWNLNSSHKHHNYWRILYTGIVGTGCGTWVLIQLLLVLENRTFY